MLQKKGQYKCKWCGVKGTVKTEFFDNGWGYAEVSIDNPVPVYHELNGFYHVFTTKLNGFIVKMVRVNGDWWDLYYDPGR